RCEPTDGLGELGDGERLLEDGVDRLRAPLIDLEAAGEERHPLSVKVAEHAETVARANVDVEQDDVDVLVMEQLLCRLRCWRFQHAIALELQIDAAEHAQTVIVVHDEHGVSGSPHLPEATVALRSRCETGRREWAARGVRSSAYRIVEAPCLGAHGARVDRLRSK